jgi:uncharacterized protein (TIGR03437 family)
MRVRSLSLFLCSGLLCSSVAFAASAPTFPVLTYSTYLRDGFTPTAIATDPSGNIYMAGYATVTSEIAELTVLVVKLNPQASQYLYVRYLGDTSYGQAIALAVDGAGNAYVVGGTASPDFPVTPGGNFATPPGSTQAPMRSFVVKLDPNGNPVFSELLGGSAASFAQAVAVTAAGQILVSGTSQTSGFPSTAGAYSVSNTGGRPYLLELDPTGTKMIFSATGIGGSALALDSSGNIFLAGTTGSLNYPTTPGTYQPTFPVFLSCEYDFCQTPTQGPNQYVTKVDPTGSTLIYSTAVSGSGNTTNTGLAADAAGNVYLTGFARPTYPFTVPVPGYPGGDTSTTLASPFLSKLDPLGQTLLFSIPVGGAGVQVDSSGSVYVGGTVGFSSLGAYNVPSNIPALANVPTQCLPNASGPTIGTAQVIQDSAYVAQVDGVTGNVLGTQFIGGSGLTASGVALSGSTLWIAGATSLPDFPFTPSALSTVLNFAPTPLAGAYLGAVDFSPAPPPAGTPQIACIADAATLAPAGPVAPYQLLTIFGTGLGPATGVLAPNGSIDQLAGVNVNFGLESAPLLYASATQINLAVPAVSAQSSTPMQVEVNGVLSTPLALPATYANPSLFPGFINADGSVNSPTHPAPLGSIISVFVNGLTPNPNNNNTPLQLLTNPGWSVTNIVQATPFVIQVDLQIPATIAPGQNRFTADFTLYDIDLSTVSPQSQVASGLAVGGLVYITETQ